MPMTRSAIHGLRLRPIFIDKLGIRPLLESNLITAADHPQTGYTDMLLWSEAQATWAIHHLHHQLLGLHTWLHAGNIIP